MPIKIKCSNPECQGTFRVKDDLAGKKVECPKCGKPIQVPAKSKKKRHHPARQECPNCGAILGVRETFCPQCGADIRTGEVSTGPTKKKRKIPWGPILKIGGLLLVLIALGVGIFFGISALMGGGEEEGGDKEAEKTAQTPQQGGPKQAAGEKEEKAEPKPKLAAQSEEEKQIVQAIKGFSPQIEQAVTGASSASSDQLARTWANLYQNAKQKGLDREAQRCWSQAVAMEPQDDAVNQTLGRTATFMGEPVTPEQKEFLEDLKPSLEVINLRPESSDLEVTVGGNSAQTLSMGGSAGFSVDAGLIKVQTTRQGDGDGRQVSFDVPCTAGFNHTVKLKTPAAAPGMPNAQLGMLYQGLRLWNQTTKEDGTLDTNKAASQRWQQRAKGWAIPIRQNQSVQATVDETGKLYQMTAGNLSVAATSDGPPRIARDGQTLQVQGLLTLESSSQRGEKHVYYGTESRSIQVAIPGGGSVARVQSGVYYQVTERISPALANIIGTINLDVAKELCDMRLRSREQEARRHAEDLEAAGKLAGPWEVEMIVEEEMEKARQEIGHDLKLQDRAVHMPAYADKVAAIQSADREKDLYLNWPRYRAALARLLGKSPAKMLEKTEQLLAAAEQKQRSQGGYGMMSGGSPSGMYGRGSRPGGRGGPQSGQGDQGEDNKLLQFLVLLPDDYAASRIKSAWKGLNVDSRRQAIRVLEQICTARTIKLLGNLSVDATEPATVVPAMIALANTGRPEALEYLSVPAVSKEVRAGVKAARCLAGDKEALNGLSSFLKDADSSSRTLFVDMITQVDGPTSAMMLPKLIEVYPADTGGGGGGMGGMGSGMGGMGSGMGGPPPGYGGGGSGEGGYGEYGPQGPGGSGGYGMGGYGEGPGGQDSGKSWKDKVAEALIRQGGHACAYELSKLIEDGWTLEPDKLEYMRPEDLTMLTRHLVQIAQGDGEEGRKAAQLLGRSGLDLALKQLKSAGGNANAVIGLAAFGTPQALQAAVKHAGTLSSEDVEAIRDDWCSTADPEENWAWRQGVNQQAAKNLLNAVVENGDEAETQLLAANILIDMGDKPAPAGLIKIASTAPSTGGEQTGGGAGRGMGGMGSMGGMSGMTPPGGAGGSGRGGPPPGYGGGSSGGYGGMGSGGYGGRSQEEEPSGPDPREQALELLERTKSGETADEFKKLAQKVDDLKLKKRILGMLVDVSGQEAVPFLREMATSTRQNYASADEVNAEVANRVAAAMALGQAGDTDFATQLVSMLQEQAPAKGAIQKADDYDQLATRWQMKMRAGAFDGLARLASGRDMQNLVGGQAFETIKQMSLKLATNPGPEDSAYSDERAMLRIAALRALAAASGASEGKGMVLLRRLAGKVDWTGSDQQGQGGGRQSSRYGGSSRPSGMSGSGSYGGYGSGRRSSGGGGSSVSDDELALLEAVALIADEPAVSELVDKAVHAIKEKEKLSDSWQEIAVNLARNDQPGGLLLTSYTLRQFSPENVQKLVRIGEEKGSSRAPEWYTLLANIATLPVQIEGSSQGGRGRGYPGEGGEGYGSGYGEGSYGGPSGYGGMGMGGQSAPSNIRYRDPLPEKVELPSSNPDHQQWLRKVRMRWRCVEMLDEGSTAALRQAAQKSNILQHPRFGPAAVLVLREKDKEQFNAVRHLQGYLQQQGSPEARRAVVSVARKMGGNEGAGLLERVMFSTGGQRGSGGGRGGPQYGGPMGRQQGGSQVQFAMPVAVYAARALGSMNRYDLLQKALKSPSGSAQISAIRGIAYLPPEQNPIAKLRSLTKNARGGEVLRAINDAIDTACRLAIKRSS